MRSHFIGVGVEVYKAVHVVLCSDKDHVILIVQQ